MTLSGWIVPTVALAALTGGGLLCAPLLFRLVAQRVARPLLRRFMTEPYVANLLELWNTVARSGAQVQFENELRSESGRVIKRPFGSPRPFRHFEALMFDFAQLDRFPLPEDCPIDLETVIGPAAAKPLVLALPLLVAPMAFGLALSERVKVALALGAARAGTATNTGEGPFLPAERAAAKKLILQYHRGSWGKDPETLRQADAIEIQFGIGARGGLGHVVPAARLDPALRRSLGLAEGQDAVSRATHPGLNSVSDLAGLVASLRELTGGVPVGAALAAGKRLERDLALLIEAGVDFISLGGAQGGTWGAPPALEDDFGLPTVYALSRASHFLAQAGLKGRVSLIVAGGLRTPGDFLKALALGADAVYLGTVALFAVTHTQALRTLPWEPPTELVGYKGRQAGRFDVERGAQSLARFLEACRAEMEEGLRALGKATHRDLTREDLMALDPVTADLCGVDLAYPRPSPLP